MSQLMAARLVAVAAAAATGELPRDPVTLVKYVGLGFTALRGAAAMVDGIIKLASYFSGDHTGEQRNAGLMKLLGGSVVALVATASLALIPDLAINAGEPMTIVREVVRWVMIAVGGWLLNSGLTSFLISTDGQGTGEQRMNGMLQGVGGAVLMELTSVLADMIVPFGF